MTTDQPTAADLLAMPDRARAAAESGLRAPVLPWWAVVTDDAAQAPVATLGPKPRRTVEEITATSLRLFEECRRRRTGENLVAAHARIAELEAENATLTEAVAVKMDSAALVENAQKQAIAAGEHAIACGDKAIALGNDLVAARIHIADLEAEVAKLRAAAITTIQPAVGHSAGGTIPNDRGRQTFPARALRFGSVAP